MYHTLVCLRSARIYSRCLICAAHLLPGPSWTHLIRRQERLQESAMAKSTKKSHTCQINCYFNFCSRYKLPVIPCYPRQACLYAAFLSEWMAPSSVVNYLSAIWRHQRAKGFRSYSSDYLLQQTIRGIRRSYKRARPHRLPLSPADLKLMFRGLNTLLPEDLVFWAATTLAFRALLRCAHYTHSSHTLRWQDVYFYPGHLILVLRTSKTD